MPQEHLIQTMHNVGTDSSLWYVSSIHQRNLTTGTLLSPQRTQTAFVAKEMEKKNRKYKGKKNNKKQHTQERC